MESLQFSEWCVKVLRRISVQQQCWEQTVMGKLAERQGDQSGNSRRSLKWSDSAPGLSCGMRNLWSSLLYVGSDPLHWEHGVLATGLLGESLWMYFEGSHAFLADWTGDEEVIGWSRMTASPWMKWLSIILRFEFVNQNWHAGTGIIIILIYLVSLNFKFSLVPPPLRLPQKRSNQVRPVVTDGRRETTDMTQWPTAYPRRQPQPSYYLMASQATLESFHL